MKKWLLIIGAALAVVSVAVLSAWLWLMHTESGARFALARADGALERLEYRRLSGSLSSNLEIDGFRLEQAGARVTAEQLGLAVRVELFNGPRILIRSLSGRDIDVYLPTGAAPPEDAPDTGPFDLGRLALPVQIDVEQLDLQTVRIHAGDGEPRLIERVQLAGGYGERLRLDRLDVVTPELTASANGEWALTSRGSGRLHVESSLAIDEATRQSVALDVDGRIDALNISATSQGPAAFTADASIRGLPGSLDVQADIEGDLAGWPGLPVDVSNLELVVSGRPGAWQASSQARVTGPDVPEGRWTVALSGDTRSLRIETLDADILGGRVTGDGTLDWHASAPRSRAELQFESIDLTPLYPDWPNQGRLSGRVAASTESGVIELEQLALSAEPGDLEVSGSGRIDPGADRIDLSLSWQNFAWPPVSDDREPLVASESGRVHVEGRISEWRAEVEALVASPRAPSASIELEARGSRERATVERLHVDAGDHGRLDLDGEIAWAPALGADVRVAFERFDPSVFVRQLPGRINGRAKVTVASEEALRIGIDIASLDGLLREQPIGGEGRMALIGGQPESADLRLSLGDNRVALNSNDAAAWTIDLEAVSLAQLWPTLAGSASLQGRFEPAAGRLDLEGEIGQLRYRQYSVDEAGIELELAWADRPEVTLALAARNLDLSPWDRLETFDFSIDGDCRAHRISLDASGGRGDIRLAASGALENCLDRSSVAWRGALESMSIGNTLAGDWRLDQPLAIDASPRSVRAGAACLVESAGTGAQLCLEALDMNEASNRVVTRLAQVPMNLLLLPLDPVFSLTTPLSGRVEAGWDTAGLSRIDGQLQLGSGVIQPIGGERDLLEINSVRLDLRPDEGSGLRAELRARLEGRSEIRGQATVADLRNLAATRLDGQAQLELPDIAAFAHLIPRIDRIGGSATGRLDLSGPVTGPSISGRLALHDGTLVHAPLGLDISAIELALSGSDNRATISGSARSGEGTLSLDGEGRLGDAGWSFETRLQGESFTFASADWLELSASPRIAFNGEPGAVRIDGDIAIDRLRAGLPPGSAERVLPSEDVEVIGERDEAEPAPPAEGARITGRLGIDLGDDARLATDGLQTELAGQLDLLWDGPPRPQGRGTIRLPSGSYRAYGQNLEIAGGEIIFSGQAIDNPRLDIRAVREIFGDPEVEAAGVAIAGSARRPEIDLFTDPPTSEDRALAYVVTGSDFDHAGGQGALSVGVYLLPRLFVSYGVGLFETGNVLSGRYEFSRHWGVRVVSGERDTGVDLSYTVNN